MQLQSNGWTGLRTVNRIVPQRIAPLSPIPEVSPAMSESQVADNANLPTHHGWEHGETRPSRQTGRLYMTSELRAATGLSRTHLDFYLREGIVQPTDRTESGYLLFDEGELDTLRAVLRWRQDGLGIKEIRDRLGRSAS